MFFERNGLDNLSVGSVMITIEVKARYDRTLTAFDQNFNCPSGVSGAVKLKRPYRLRTAHLVSAHLRLQFSGQLTKSLCRSHRFVDLDRFLSAYK